MTMNTYIPYISVNITALCCFSLMLVTFLAAKKTPEIKSFLLVLADCILWSGASILMRFQMWPGAISGTPYRWSRFSAWSLCSIILCTPFPIRRASSC